MSAMAPGSGSKLNPSLNLHTPPMVEKTVLLCCWCSEVVTGYAHGSLSYFNAVGNGQIRGFLSLVRPCHIRLAAIGAGIFHELNSTKRTFIITCSNPAAFGAGDFSACVGSGGPYFV